MHTLDIDVTEYISASENCCQSYRELKLSASLNSCNNCKEKDMLAVKHVFLYLFRFTEESDFAALQLEIGKELRETYRAHIASDIPFETLWRGFNQRKEEGRLGGIKGNLN